jgi:hypothetical protein
MSKPISIWVPQAGSQEMFMSSPAWETLLEGNRGGGKTDVLIMDFLQDVGVGHGAAWRGILFRESFPQLEDVIAKCHKWIPQIFPTAKWNGSKHSWTFEEGECLLLRFMEKPEDYWNYHGHEYPWIGWEELTNWATPECYLVMMSCNRSSTPGIVRKYRSTCNPGGIGNQWVKKRFSIRLNNSCKITTDEYGQTITYITSRLSENKILLKADPTYKDRLMTQTQDDPIKRKAWIFGDWNIIAGAALTDLWDSDIHEIEPFTIPKSWRIFRTFDYGQAKPWAVTYIAESNGESSEDGRYFPKGTSIVIEEIYGWNGKPNEGDAALTQEIAERILLRDQAITNAFGIKVQPGPADTSIWEVKDGQSVANALGRFGVYWTRAYKGSGSRIAGLAQMRQMLGAAKRQELDNPGLYFFDTVYHHIRTLTTLQRDKKKPEDVNTEQEDHLYDSLRYGLLKKKTSVTRRKVKI